MHRDSIEKMTIIVRGVFCVNQTIRVFLSSSFRDMHAERDFLQRNALATLRAELAMKGYSLHVLDLRGTTVDPTQSQEEAVLRMCLEGIEDCIPFFIGLVGDRYGWIPYGKGASYMNESARARAIAAVTNLHDAPDFPITRDEIDGISVTHLEIQYGLKRMQPANMFFYRRSGLPYDSMPEDIRTLYCEGADKQAALWQEIQSRMQSHPTHCQSYNADWDENAGQVSGLEALNNMVYQHLTACFAEYLRPNQVSPELARLSLQRLYLDSVGCEALFGSANKGLYTSSERDKKCRRLIMAESARFLRITGKPGSGVTAMLGKLYYDMGINSESRILGRYISLIGYSPEASPHMPTLADMLLYLLLRAHEILDISLYYDSPHYERFATELEPSFRCHAENLLLAQENPHIIREHDLEDGFALLKEMLAIIAKRSQVVIVISDAHLITNRGFPDPSLSWLSHLDLPGVSTVFSYAGEDFAPFVNVTTTYLEPWKDASGTDGEGYDSACQISIQHAARYGKQLDDDILARIATLTVNNEGTPLYAQLITDFLMNMTGEDYAAFPGEDGHLQYMRAQLDTMPDTTPGVYQRLIGRVQAAHGELADCFLMMLSFHEEAIPDSALQHALDLALGKPVSDLELLTLRGFMHYHLKQADKHTVWALAHRRMREAILDHYDATLRQRCASALCEAILQEQDMQRHACLFLPIYAWFSGSPAQMLHFFELARQIDDQEYVQLALAFCLSKIDGTATFYRWIEKVIEELDVNTHRRLLCQTLMEHRPRGSEAERAYAQTMDTCFTLLESSQSVDSPARADELLFLRLKSLEKRLVLAPIGQKGDAHSAALYAQIIALAQSTTDADENQPACDAILLQATQARLNRSLLLAEETADRNRIAMLLATRQEPYWNELLYSKNEHFIGFLTLAAVDPGFVATAPLMACYAQLRNVTSRQLHERSTSATIARMKAIANFACARDCFIRGESGNLLARKKHTKAGLKYLNYAIDSDDEGIGPLSNYNIVLLKLGMISLGIEYCKRLGRKREANLLFHEWSWGDYLYAAYACNGLQLCQFLTLDVIKRLIANYHTRMAHLGEYDLTHPVYVNNMKNNTLHMLRDANALEPLNPDVAVIFCWYLRHQITHEERVEVSLQARMPHAEESFSATASKSDGLDALETYVFLSGRRYLQADMDHNNAFKGYEPYANLALILFKEKLDLLGEEIVSCSLDPDGHALLLPYLELSACVVTLCARVIQREPGRQAALCKTIEQFTDIAIPAFYSMRHAISEEEMLRLAHAIIAHSDVIDALDTGALPSQGEALAAIRLSCDDFLKNGK